jgi:hypothetical protein
LWLHTLPLVLQLFGTSSTWFFLDIAFYSQNLFQTQVFTVIGWVPPAATMNALTEAYKLARAQASGIGIQTCSGKSLKQNCRCEAPNCCVSQF